MSDTTFNRKSFRCSVIMIGNNSFQSSDCINGYSSFLRSDTTFGRKSRRSSVTINGCSCYLISETGNVFVETMGEGALDIKGFRFSSKFSITIGMTLSGFSACGRLGSTAEV